MKLLFACGGTAGHINPALAVAGDVKGRHPEAEIAFVGNPRGMEAKLVPAAGYRFFPVEIMGFQRQLSWFNIKYNCKSVYCFLKCWGETRRIIKEFSPDVVVGTGGYVSGPVLQSAHKQGIPTITHESNAFPGVTTRLLAKTADKMLLVNKACMERMPKGGRYIITGNPVRREILFADRETARAKLGVGDAICIVSFGGSLGAKAINTAVAELMIWEQRQGGFYHIHATGSYDGDRFVALLNKGGVTLPASGLDVRQFISDMPDCLAAADLVICRSGAMTVAEIEASASAAVLIPSPNVAENHQYHNAKVLEDHGGGVVLEEKHLTPKRLRETIQTLCQDRDTLRRLGENARSLAMLDANERIYGEVMSLMSR